MTNLKIKNPKKPSGPVEVNDYIVEVDRDLCISAATCMAIAPNAYTLDKEAKAIILKGIDKLTLEELIDSAKACPTSAIIIKTKDGKKIYPK